MDIKLIALDLDGTLLLPDKSLSPRNRAALTAAADRGIHIVPTTGRLFAGLPEVVITRARALLRHFGSLKAVRAATVDELCLVKGVSRPAAENIKRYFETRED